MSGFEASDNFPHFTIEVLKSDNNVITHSNQSELPELTRGLMQEFGIYDKRLAKKTNLSVLAYSDLKNI